MLKAVYPAMKAANPAVQVLNGGLLLDKPYNATMQAGLSARFLEGVFVAGAGDSFDIVSYHSYSYYGVSMTTTDGNTGSVDWKVAYLRQLMDTYRVPQKPLLNTESALLCYTASAACQQAQADAIPRMFARAMRDGLLGNVWYIYDSDAFRNTGLVEPGNIIVQRPGYAAFKQSMAMLGGSTYVGALTGQAPGVEGYRFRRNGQTITVLWSNAAQVVNLQVGAARVSCSGRDGTALACANVGGGVTLNAVSGPSYVVEQ